MSQPFLSDEEIFATLENVVDSISKKVPSRLQPRPYKFPAQEIKEELQQQGYNPKMSFAFLRACYWHLHDQKVLDVDPSNQCCLTEKITEDKKTDLCMEIFTKYHRYLQANYERSLTNPDPYLKSEKSPDSSPGFGFSESRGGK